MATDDVTELLEHLVLIPPELRDFWRYDLILTLEPLKQANPEMVKIWDTITPLEILVIA